MVSPYVPRSPGKPLLQRSAPPAPSPSDVAKIVEDREGELTAIGTLHDAASARASIGAHSHG